jgi:hypothetical protein
VAGETQQEVLETRTLLSDQLAHINAGVGQRAGALTRIEKQLSEMVHQMQTANPPRRARGPVPTVQPQPPQAVRSRASRRTSLRRWWLNRLSSSGSDNHDGRKDLIIGCFTDYDWTSVQYWAHSIVKCGFGGDKVVLVHNTDRYTIDCFKALGFTIVGFDPDDLSRAYQYAFTYPYNYAHRFQAYSEYLSRLPDIDQYRYVIATDVRDVVFQRNPSAWLRSHLGNKAICASSESVRYRDEPWGDDSMRTSFPRLYPRMSMRPVWNCGVQAGDTRVMSDFWLQLTMTTAAGLRAADQAAYNILLSLRPWSDITHFTMSENGWACQAGTAANDKLRLHLLEPAPLWDGEFSCTSTGEPHVILHQYDRVPQWREIVQRRYASA